MWRGVEDVRTAPIASRNLPEFAETKIVTGERPKTLFTTQFTVQIFMQGQRPARSTTIFDEEGSVYVTYLNTYYLRILEA